MPGIIVLQDPLKQWNMSRTTTFIEHCFNYSQNIQFYQEYNIRPVKFTEFSNLDAKNDACM
eukprot:2004832-Ditylum_brightwellii.AAC.1